VGSCCLKRPRKSPSARDEQGKRLGMDVSVGETVLFAKYAGTEFKVDGKKLLILKESDLLAIVETAEEGKKKK
jgi:chaperonin GroES